MTEKQIERQWTHAFRRWIDGREGEPLIEMDVWEEWYRFEHGGELPCSWVRYRVQAKRSG